MDKLLKISELILFEHNTGIPFKNLEKPLVLNNEDEAYNAQFIFQKNARRGKIGGYKIALASKVQQQLCSINNPIAGGVFKKEIYQSSKSLNLNNFNSLGIEFEVAFEINQDILPVTLNNKNIDIKNYYQIKQFFPYLKQCSHPKALKALRNILELHLLI